MEVIEQTAEGLERKFTVKVPASELDEKLTKKIEEIKGQVHLKGFRKGKAPVSFLKKMYGKGMMGEIVQELVAETSQKAFSERDMQPATPPSPKFHNDLDEVIAGKADLEYDVQAEILPEFEPADVSEIELERMVADVPDQDVQEALDNIAAQQKTYTERDEGAAAEDGDMVTVDYVGRIDGETFEGGSGDNVDLVLGSGTFIPGFEDQLVGAKIKDDVEVKVTFPEDYNAKDLAGKEAVFACSVTAVKAADDVAIDDELAKKVGLDSLEDLKTRLRERIEEEFKSMSRGHMKRSLLDKLDNAHNFDLPTGMVNAEFEQIWAQVENAERDEEDKDKSEDELKEEYRGIAERRVRLGLVLAEIGKRAEVDVPQDDLQREILNTARGFPGQEKEVLEFYQKNPQALAQLRAPLFEEKVVDYIFERAKVTENKVTKEDLMKDPEGEDG
ncbi:MAG: trigger factor [Pseudomonadota bacterium]